MEIPSNSGKSDHCPADLFNHEYYMVTFKTDNSNAHSSLEVAHRVSQQTEGLTEHRGGSLPKDLKQIKTNIVVNNI